MIPTAQEIIPKLDKWDYMKLKTFFIANDTIPRIKSHSTKWGGGEEL